MSASRKNIDIDWVIAEYKSGISVENIAKYYARRRDLSITY